jgi:hypothetical protein
LAVQAFLFQELKEGTEEEDEDEDPLEKRKVSLRNFSPLRKLHNIVVHTRGSPTRTRQFMELATRNIPLDNSTRWNSWYEMLKVAIEKESAIDSYSKTWYDDL